MCGVGVGYILHSVVQTININMQKVDQIVTIQSPPYQAVTPISAASIAQAQLTTASKTLSVAPPVVPPPKPLLVTTTNAESAQQLMSRMKQFIAEKRYTQAFPLFEELLFQIQEVYSNSELEELFIRMVSDQRTVLQNDLNAQLELLNYAITILPEYKGFIYDLAEIHMSIGELEQAKYYLSFISYDVNWREKSITLLDAIRYQELFTGGELQIPLIPKTNAWHIEVRVNGVKAVLILDTGATTTVIRESLLPENYTKLKKVVVSTANGKTDAYISKVGLDIAPISYPDFEVLVLEGTKLPKNVDGLLGVDFLNKYHFIIDKSNNILQLNPLS